MNIPVVNEICISKGFFQIKSLVSFLSTQPAFLEKRSTAQTLVVSMVHLTILSITIKSLTQYNLLKI
jgi:hypothetical protein